MSYHDDQAVMCGELEIEVAIFGTVFKTIFMTVFKTIFKTINLVPGLSGHHCHKEPVSMEPCGKKV